MRKTLAVMVASILCLSMFPTLAPNAKTQNELLDTIIVDSIDGSRHYSSMILENNIEYRLEVSGIYEWGDNPSLEQHDAKYATNDGWATYWGNPPTPGRGNGGAGGLYMVGWDLGFKPWGDYRADHTYQYVIFGQGTTVGFWIYDSYYGDNSGTLTVKIHGEIGPVGDWEFEEGSGTIARDSSTKGNDGVITNAQYVSGKNSEFALEFSGPMGYYVPANSYVTVQDSASLRPSSGFTVETWVKAYAPYGISHIVSKEYGSGRDNSYCLWYEYDGKLRFAFEHGDYAVETPIPPMNQWHHIAATWDGSTVCLYVDGLKVASRAFSRPIPYDSNPVLIGADDNNGDDIADEGWNGLIDSAKIYDYARTAEEILYDYGLRSPIKVLHVSTNMNYEVQRIVDDVSATAVFMITQVSLQDFNAGSPAYLSQYDVVVFGVNNEGESAGPYAGVYGRTAELKSYIQSGGGIVWTHDTLEYVNDYGDNIEQPVGVNYDTSAAPPWVGAVIPNIRILHDNPVLHEPFQIGHVGDLIPKTYNIPNGVYDHSTGGTVTTAQIIIEHETTSSSKNYYLTVNEYGDGRVALDVLGDAMGGDGLTLESIRENQILVNAMYWAARAHPFSETIEFSGYTWNVKNSESLIGPGSNYWSNSFRNVWVDGNGWLHLRITSRNGKWYCAEVNTTQPLGYGTYVFYVASRVDNLDQNVVMSVFSSKDDDHEVDVEFSRWGDINRENAQYVVQPAPYAEDNRRIFNVELTGDYSTHYFSWSPNNIFFESYHGHYPPKAAPPWNIIQSWLCTQSRVGEDAKAHINLWLYQGTPPSDGNEVEVVIKEFRFSSLGDIDSNNKCDCVDLFTLARAFGSDSTQPNWNPNADINNDGTVNASDLLLFVMYYGKTN